MIETKDLRMVIELLDEKINALVGLKILLFAKRMT